MTVITSGMMVRLHRLLDVLMGAAAFALAYFTKKYLLFGPFKGLAPLPDYHIILLMAVIIRFVVFDWFNLYRPYGEKRPAEVLFDTVKALCVSMTILVFAMYVAKITDVSRIMMGLFFFYDLSFSCVEKAVIYRVLFKFRQQGFDRRNVLVVGSRERAREVISVLLKTPDTGFAVVGCLEADPERVGLEVARGVKVIGLVYSLEKILTENVVDELIYAMPLKLVPGVREEISLAESMGVAVRIVPDWQIHGLFYRPGIAKVRFEEVRGLPTLALTPTTIRYGQLFLKSAIDLTLTTAVLFLLLPFFIVIGLSIRLSSPGPVFFRQVRCGRNGRRFVLYKFRTMSVDAEQRRCELQSENEADGPVFKMRQDPRVVPGIGRVLRRTFVDELPQFFNVLKGEMSLVGPRPPLPAEVDCYDLAQRRRLSMKPGITCLWQIHPHRHDMRFSEWAALDFAYIDNWSLLLDFKILARTVNAVLRGTGR